MGTAMIALLVNPLSGQEYNLQRYSVSIGRELGNDIVIASDKTISRQHALVHTINGEYFVEDLGSKNGSWVNGHPITQRAPLSSGDELRVGITRLIFLLVPEKLQLPDADVIKSPRTDPLGESVISGSRTI